jgi:hypothetical protein
MKDDLMTRAFDIALARAMAVLPLIWANHAPTTAE